MSEADNQATDILLPTAGVGIISRDPETLSTARQLLEDWRFARVTVDIEEGDVETAIEKYTQYASPELLIIQTEDIDDAFLARLEELAGQCSEGTSAVVLGPVNDVYLYRNLIEMGVSDYLVRPIQLQVLSEVVAKTLITQLGVSGSRLITFMGAKGGVGTSSIIQAAAWGVSEVLKKKACLIDASGGWSSLSVGMSFDPAGTLREISRAVEKSDEDSMNRMFYEASEHLTVMSGGGDAMLDKTITPEQYEKFLDMLMVKSPIVMVDISGAEPELKKLLVSRSNQIVLVTTPTVTSLRFARTLIKEISDLRGGDADEVSLLVNKQGVAKQFEVSGSDIQEAIDMAPAGYVPHMPELFMGHESDAKFILEDKEGLEVLQKKILPILSKTLSVAQDTDSDEKNEKKSGLLGGLLTKMSQK